MIRTWPIGCGNKNRKNGIASEDSAGFGWRPCMGSRESGGAKYELGDEETAAAVKETANSDCKCLRK